MIDVLVVAIVAVLALFALGALALMLHWGHKRDVGLAPYVFYLSILAAGLAGALTPRDLSLPDGFSAASGSMPGFVAWIGRFSSIFVILTCGERILNRLVSKPGRPLPRLLMAAFWLYFATNILSPAFLGRHPSVSHEHLYVALFAQAAMLFSMREVDMTIKTLRNALFAFLLGSAVLLVLKPGQVLDTGYSGLIPFLPGRYAGLASHANTLGPLTVLFLLCVWRHAFSKRWFNRFAWCLGLGTLLLAQSKTSWIAFMFSACCLAYYSYRDEISARLYDHRRPAFLVLMVSGAMFALTVVIGILIFADVDGRFASFAASRQANELSSFSGRSAIWQIALVEWDRNPVFGYGLTIWNKAYQLSIGMPFATHAHGQFFQAVSSAGTVGLVGLIGYTLVLIYLSLKTAQASGGMTLAILISLIMRAISEIPLSLTGFWLEPLAHLTLIVMLTGYCMQERAKYSRTVLAGNPVGRLA